MSLASFLIQILTPFITISATTEPEAGCVSECGSFLAPLTCTTTTSNTSLPCNHGYSPDVAGVAGVSYYPQSRDLLAQAKILPHSPIQTLMNLYENSSSLPFAYMCVCE